MKPIKNPETQKLCELVAATYKIDKQKANTMFKDFVSENNPKRWEVLAMQDQIRHLIGI